MSKIERKRLAEFLVRFGKRGGLYQTHAAVAHAAVGVNTFLPPDGGRYFVKPEAWGFSVWTV